MTDLLRQYMGRLTPIVDITLLSETNGLPVAAGGDTLIPGVRLLNLADANLSQARLVVDGTTTGGTIVVDVFDPTANTVVASVTMGAGAVAGGWTVVAAQHNRDTTLQLRVHGDGTHTQTLFLVAIQFRTSAPL